MTYEKVLYSLQDGVARISMNDPATRNAGSAQMGEELFDAFNRAAFEARAVLLTGEGKAFNSGANLADAEGIIDDPMRDVGGLLDRYYNPVIIAMKEMEQPVVTAVRGAAAGVGCGLAMAGDLVVCGEDGFFLQAFCHVGLVPDGGSSWLLAKAVGRVRAMELMLLGERLYGPKALEWGLVNYVVPDDQVEDTAMNLARRLAKGPRSLGLIKRNAWAATDSSLETALINERLGQRDACRSEDFIEGVTAFKAKRQPEFKGR
ncbi:MAG TPA: enoyl-CoA hydratase-related protein [Novosphingobium sp.]